MDKDIKKLLKALEAQGFETFVLKTGHIRVTIAGTFVTVFASTGGRGRGNKNGLAKCRAFGFVWPAP